MALKVYPVILCGGSGTRLWPMSRKSFPKQFAPLPGERSLFRQCLNRCKHEDFFPPTIVTSSDYRFIVAQQLVDEDISSASIILEPSSKNTAPSIIAAATHISRYDDNGIMVVMPSDHFISDNESFTDVTLTACDFAQTGQIVTFGIIPTRPDTGYGYIKVSENGNATCFVEKPDQATAELMFSSGDYLWNAGIFVVSCQTHEGLSGNRAIDVG